MPFPFLFEQSLGDFLRKFFEEFYWEIVLGILVAILALLCFFGRYKIRRWLFGRRVKPIVKQVMSVYEKRVLPEFVEAKPKMKLVEKKEDIPSELPFGYIFIPIGQEELIWDVLLTCLPVSCSLRRVRVLFDENLRKSMFDVLSYKLGLHLGKTEIAVRFRDNAVKVYPDDFKVMETIYDDGKLTAVILQEASIRFRKTGGQISISDVEEFSTLVRKMAEIDAVVARIGDKSVSSYVEEIIEKKRGVVLLARGGYMSKAVDVANQLRDRGYTMFTSDELGFGNPEIGTWHFIRPKGLREKFSFMRIWLKRITPVPSNEKWSL